MVDFSGVLRLALQQIDLRYSTVPTHTAGEVKMLFLEIHSRERRYRVNKHMEAAQNSLTGNVTPPSLQLFEFPKSVQLMRGAAKVRELSWSSVLHTSFNRSKPSCLGMPGDL